jgi:hypothetical protein
MSGAHHWFWTLVTLACMLWYCTITFLVAYRGAIDIHAMLTRLRQAPPDETDDSTNSESRTDG